MYGAIGIDSRTDDYLNVNRIEENAGIRAIGIDSRTDDYWNVNRIQENASIWEQSVSTAGQMLTEILIAIVWSHRLIHCSWQYAIFLIIWYNKNSYLLPRRNGRAIHYPTKVPVTFFIRDGCNTATTEYAKVRSTFKLNLSRLLSYCWNML